MKGRLQPYLFASLLLVLVLIVTACAAPAGPAAADSGGAMAGDGEEMAGRPLPDDAAEEQVIRYVTRNFSRMNPASEGGFGRPFVSHIWMTLFLRDYEHHPQPWLATGYDVSDDGLTYTIHIHPDAIWSDGSAVTAQDVKVYWEYAVSPECIGCRMFNYSAIKLIEGIQPVVDGEADEISGLVAVDDKTLEITLVAPKPIIIDTLANYNTAIVKLDDILEGGEMWAADGSARVNGPFKVKVWDPDTQEYEVEQNPMWWGDRKPYIERIIGQASADENVSFIMWQNDEVDIAHWLTNIREPLRADNPESFTLIPYATNFFYTLNTSLPPFDDINVRRALVHAVDWDLAIEAAWEGARSDRVMKTHLTPEIQCYKADNWPDFGYNPELAKEELAASKYRGPEDLPKIRITTNGQSPNYIRTAEIMMEMWKNNLGITNVEMRPGRIDAWGQEGEEVQVLRRSSGAVIPDSGEWMNGFYQRLGDPARQINIVDEDLGALVDEMALYSSADPEYCDFVQEVESRILGHYYLLPMIWDLYEYNTKPWIVGFDTNVDNNWTSLLDMYVAER
ncbi:MAG: ABC transporter substrate-binding protein [Caldilineaceae bacterium]|nr:ABC transporter substrate-binding protein [Caldilineaceae bacterium]